LFLNKIDLLNHRLSDFNHRKLLLLATSAKGGLLSVILFELSVIKFKILYLKLNNHGKRY